MGTGSRGDRQEKANCGLWLQRGRLGQRGCPTSRVPPGAAPSFPGPEGSHPTPGRGSSCSRSGRRSRLQTTPLPQPQSGLPPRGVEGQQSPHGPTSQVLPPPASQHTRPGTLGHTLSDHTNSQSHRRTLRLQSQRPTHIEAHTRTHTAGTPAAGAQCEAPSASHAHAPAAPPARPVAW